MEQFTANKKPLFDSDIDPKRIKSVADGLRRQGEFESARMLDGYADLLEAREKAVPVELDFYDAGLLNDFGGGNVIWWWDYMRDELGRAHSFYQSQVNDMMLEAREKAVPVYQHRSKNGSMLRWFDCSEEIFMAMEYNEHDKEHFDRRILYTHPAPADAGRWAEALRKKIKEWRGAYHHITEWDRGRRAGLLAAADYLERLLAAHSAQAQPPAASVPSAVVELPAQWEKLSELDCGNVGCHAKGTLLTCAQELRNALATQENPND